MKSMFVKRLPSLNLGAKFPRPSDISGTMLVFLKDSFSLGRSYLMILISLGVIIWRPSEKSE